MEHLTESTKQTIEKAAAPAGLDKIVVVTSPTDGNQEKIFDVYDKNENYVFSIDAENNTVFEK